MDLSGHPSLCVCVCLFVSSSLSLSLPSPIKPDRERLKCALDRSQFGRTGNLTANARAGGHISRKVARRSIGKELVVRAINQDPSQSGAYEQLNLACLPVA